MDNITLGTIVYDMDKVLANYIYNTNDFDELTTKLFMMNEVHVKQRYLSYHFKINHYYYQNTEELKNFIPFYKEKYYKAIDYLIIMIIKKYELNCKKLILNI